MIVGCRHLAGSDSEAACFETDDGAGYCAWMSTPSEPTR